MLKKLERDVLRQKAVVLRNQGKSYPLIERELGVSRSTLSGWFSGLTLEPAAVEQIRFRKQQVLEQARLQAAKKKKEQNVLNRLHTSEQVQKECFNIEWTSTMKELLLAMLYLGEGFKKRSHIGLGNSDAQILAIFVGLLRNVCHAEESRLRCHLYLRSDQDPQQEEIYWSEKLSIPRSQFRKAHFDKRTTGRETRPGYHGVCAVYCYDAHIEKRLTAFQEVLRNQIYLKGG